MTREQYGIETEDLGKNQVMEKLQTYIIHTITVRCEDSQEKCVN